MFLIYSYEFIISKPNSQVQYQTFKKQLIILLQNKQKKIETGKKSLEYTGSNI